MSIGCQKPTPVVELRTQATLSQDEHSPQQQCSAMCFRQSLASRSVQGLPEEARLHSDRIHGSSQSSLFAHVLWPLLIVCKTLTWCHCTPADAPASHGVVIVAVGAEEEVDDVTFAGDWAGQGVAAVLLH